MLAFPLTTSLFGLCVCARATSLTAPTLTADPFRPLPDGRSVLTLPSRVSDRRVWPMPKVRALAFAERYGADTVARVDRTLAAEAVIAGS